MASPSSLMEQVNILSTATTTLWELVSPIDSCRCCIVFVSSLPRLNTRPSNGAKTILWNIVHGSKNQNNSMEYCSWLQESKQFNGILFMAPRIKTIQWNIVHGSKNQNNSMEYCSWLQESKQFNGILFMAPRIKMIVILNLRWSEFAETIERRFETSLNRFGKFAPT